MGVNVSAKPGAKPTPITSTPAQVDEELKEGVHAPSAPHAAEPVQSIAKVEPKPDAPKTKVRVSELAAVINQVRKDHGEKTVVKGSEVPDVKRLPTGDFEFDFNTGGGWPRGRLAIIYGPESSCKTTMALRAAAVAQRGPEECNKVVFVDLEHSFDGPRAAELGVDIDALIVIKPSYGEEAADIAEAVVRAEDVALVIIDSLATIIASKEIEQSMEKFDVGTSAILIKRMTNKINVALAMEAKRDHYPSVILINQIRYKIGVMFGNPETTPGGKTPHFLSALTIRVSGKNKVVKEVNPDTPVMKELSFQIIKAKVGVIKSQWTMDMAMVAFGDLLAGETKSFDAVKNELQAHGLLKKADKGGGWVLDGMNFKTISMIEDNYYADADYSLKLQQMVIAQYTGKKYVFDDTKKIEDAEPAP